VAVPFDNPMEDVPAIEAEAELSLLETDAGGLAAPLELPSPSLVFRDLEAEGIVGYTVVIGNQGDLPLKPGQTLTCGIRFVGVPREKVWEGRQFALWAGSDKGRATILSVARQS
jgi:hypothetical protein